MRKRFHGAHADHADAVLGAGLEQRVKEVVRVLDREVQLPAQGADEVDAQRVARPPRAPPRWSAPVSQGKASLSSGVSVSLREHSRETAVPATTKQPRALVMLRRVTEPSLGSALLQVVAVVALRGPGAHHVEVLVGDLGDGELRADAAALR